MATGGLEKAKVKRVVDGDTIHLADGRKVRLVGINTPELDHKKGRHEPYAVQATDFLRAQLGQFVYLQRAKDDSDRYGRNLYYLFDKDRISLTSRLLSEGLGYRIAVPPNLEYQDCFKSSEGIARNTHKGLWQHPLQWRPKAGFAISRVNITSITQNRGGWWLETDQNLVINLPSNATNYWPAQRVFSLEGKVIEVRGWQHQRKSRHSDFASWVLSVRHPNDLLDIKASFNP
ncbi:thermonuclease family protein [Marinomonas sp. IMCC 4694]|uniref:thermonuclease family protein n=1 Tax=Marinomonas sp. IMCC 4694 TaxID=2605432 RepID=UPI0021CCC3F8|nr:thermonuclease family protein [Marinomonas sp. IMCC 4694]